MTRARRALLAAGFLGATAAAACGYALLDSTWNFSPVTMHLQLGSSGTLIDGSSSWNASAEDALAAWNARLLRLQFTVVRDSTATPADDDGVNNVFFSSTFYGRSFGDAVAITTEWTVNNGKRRIEADTIFNSNLDWNSYRGSLRTSSQGNTLYDLHRVALHEFGHVVGLDHPDEQGQVVSAVMNSFVSNVDELRPDDIRGGQALYGARGGGGDRVTPPSSSRKTTRSNRYLFRGKADAVAANAVLLVNTRLGSKRFFRANGVESWRRRIALRPGANRIKLYIKKPGGAVSKVDQITVIRE
jgi:hypothetical protein